MNKSKLNIQALDLELSTHFSKWCEDENEMKNLRHQFQKNGYVCFKDFSFLPAEILHFVHAEIHDLLDKSSVRIDVQVPSTENTYRKMHNVNQPEIKQDGKFIPYLYEQKNLVEFLGRIANDDIVSCWEEEQYLITKLSLPGDTHGWHWGDYPYTMIWIIEAPKDPKIGGVLQCIPHTEWDKKQPNIWKYILSNPINSYHHLKGDVYFLKSDTTLHHVIPIAQKTTRIILNTCWASKYDRRKNVEHESIGVIWDTKLRT